MFHRSVPARRRALVAAASALVAAVLPAIPAAAAPAVVPVAQPPAAGPCGPLDVTFVIDDTGSMGGAIANIKAGINTIIGDVSTLSGGDFKLGLVTFKDDVKVLNDLAAGNQAAVTAGVNGLVAGGGGGGPEASDEALNTAVNNLPAAGRPQTGNFSGVWRSNATKMIILVTDALPGGFDDTHTAVDVANAHTRALQAQNNIKINSVYVPTGGVSAPVVTIMQDYATTTGGVYTQTAANGSNTATTIQQSLRNCRRTDVFVRDHAADTGVEPHGLNPIWTSPDITVCPSPAPCAGTNPVVGGTSYIHVKLNNPGPNGAGTATGDLKLYYTAQGGAAIWPTHWTHINTATNVTVPAGTTNVVIPWNGVPGPGHFCLLARWVSATDPMTFAEGPNTLTNTRNNNNIAWRNVDTVRVKPGTPTTRPFTLANPNPRALTNLVFTAPEGPFAGKVTIDLGRELAARWKQSGGKAEGIRQVGETAFEIVDGKRAVLAGLAIDPKERFETKIDFTATADQARAVVWVNQTDEKGEDLGGVEFRLTTE
ncbi:vWA domain-containing protein [Actinokineospora auranticolor]|uniref:von Willebrand factor type A domain-containing protein n=1 Tax=Actinokineospora auranticolor TaxID=155976 RepID=A0A2S6GMK6_9PSEU|nr:vWA domain-containing protein [Actinokineospora auranticolor]PPK66410.1 von Willebrand factor type A domain-containing protein [Actinokineospora auranticolor]